MCLHPLPFSSVVKPDPPKYGPWLSASEQPDSPHWQAVHGLLSFVFPGELTSSKPFGRPLLRWTPLIHPSDGQDGHTGLGTQAISQRHPGNHGVVGGLCSAKPRVMPAQTSSSYQKRPKIDLKLLLFRSFLAFLHYLPRAVLPRHGCHDEVSITPKTPALIAGVP